MKKVLLWFLFTSGLLTAQNASVQTAMRKLDFETAFYLLSKEKANPETELLKAKCCKNLSRYNEAVAILEPLIQRNESGEDAAFELADCYQLSGNYKKAKFYGYMALQSAPENRYLQTFYINILYKLKEWKPCISLARSMLQKDSTFQAVYSLLGDCYVQTSNADSAFYYYHEALRLNPDDYGTLGKLSKFNIQNHNFPDLVISTAEFIRRDSTNQQINQYNGIGLCQLNAYRFAINRLERVCQEGDSSYVTHYYLGAAYLGIQDYMMAYQHFNQAFQLDSTNINLYFYLGKSAIHSASYEKGIRILKKGLGSIVPSDSVLFDYYHSISEGYERLSRYVQEVEFLKLSCQVKPDYVLGLRTIAVLYDYSLKNKNEAINWYNQFIASKEQYPASFLKYPELVKYYNESKLRVMQLQQNKQR